MPTFRKLHVKIVDSFDFAEMPDDFTRLLWVLMIVAVDSQGRGIDNPNWINSRMFPLDQRQHKDIEQAMAWLSDRGMIRRYEYEGRKYFDIPTFHQYQTGTEKEARSVLPAYPLLQSNSRVGQELVESGSTTSGSTASASASVNASVSVNDSASAEVFRVFSNEVGTLTPSMADAVGDAIDTYSPDWVIAAIKEAALSNARNWRYIVAILKRWKVEGFKSKNGRKPDGNKSEPASYPALRRAWEKENGPGTFPPDLGEDFTFSNAIDVEVKDAIEK